MEFDFTGRENYYRDKKGELSMNDTAPNLIKEYYIAYFDILGYQEFFRETPEKELDFLNTIHEIITKTENYVQGINQSSLASLVGNLHIQTKIFSDNVLLCIEVGDDCFREKARIIAFMGLVSEIQRRIITEYSLFVRGSFTKGKLSINDKYVFGEGLIEAVKMEESTSHPRIAVSSKIISYLERVTLLLQEDLDKAASIENRVNAGEVILDGDIQFYRRILQLGNIELFERTLCQNMLYFCDDGVCCLSYLYVMNIFSILPEHALAQVMQIIKQSFPNDYEKLPKSSPDIDVILSSHKQIIEQKLKKHSNYTLFNTDEIKKFDYQEKILKKYVWSMVYHNYICQQYNKMEHYINTQGNCERRHMKLVIHVLDREGKITD